VLERNQSEISSELERASRSVRKLGSLLFEMEVLRSFLETESEIKYFDKRVVPCKIRAYVAIQKLKAVCPAGSASPKCKEEGVPGMPRKTGAPLARSLSDSEPSSLHTTTPLHIMNQTNKRLRSPKICNSPHLSPKKEKGAGSHFVFGADSVSPSCATLGGVSTLEVLYEDPEEDVASLISEDDQRRLIADDDSSDEVFSCPNQDPSDQTATAWKLLEEEICDIFILMNQFSSKLLDGNEKPGPEDEVEDDCCQDRAGFSTSKAYPMAGAVLGTCLGGPVGFLAGVKIGGLAAVGGSIFGYSTGSIIKEHAQRQEFIEEFYAKHPKTSRASVRAEIGRLQSKRAVSLPNVLEEDHYSSIKPRRCQQLKGSRTEGDHAKSSEDLLLM